MSFDNKQQLALEIENIILEPQHLRPGEEVKCRVKLRPTWNSVDLPKVYFKVRGHVYLASETYEPNLFEASWTASDRDGNYPITLVLNWPSGRKKVAYVGNYLVDSKPPRISLDLKGVSLQGTVAFRDQVLIIPHMIDREPIMQWKISVENDGGDEIMSDKGRGNLPQRFVWNGKQKNGAHAEEGIYQIVLQTWDRAKNMGISSKHVMYSKTPPAMVLETNEMENEMTVDLRNDGKIPTAFWRMEMRSDDGRVLRVADGEDLPVRIGVPSSDDKRKVECVVEIRDVLGNRTRTEIKDLHMYAKQSEELADAGTEAVVAVPKAWLEEF